LVSTGLSALHGLFSGRPSSSCLPPEMNSQLVTALYEYQPGVNDGAPLVAWLAVQQEGILNLAQNQPDLAHGQIARFAQTCLSCLLSDRAEAVKATGLALKAVLGEAGRDMDSNVAAKLTKVLGEGLCYQYHAAWPVLLPVLQTLVEVMGSSQTATLTPLLVSLAALRGSHGFNLEGAVDGIIGAAIAAVGPRLVLQAVPLNITAAENEDREFRSSWLLPVLREHIKHTELAFFSEYFLPLAAKCYDRSHACAAQQDLIGQKAYEALTYQMWSLLPGFCNSPTDLTTSFRGVAKTLGVQLGSRKEVRLDILTGLRHLISGNLDNVENRTVIASYAKNFLPILFNLYVAVPAGAEEAGQRLAAFETAKLFYQISDPNMVNNMFDKALQMHKSDVVFTRDAVMDLLRSMIPHIDISRIEILYKETMSRVESKDQKEQKKSYRLLEELCRGPSPAVRTFLTSALPQLRATLLSSLSATSPSSQAPRLRCLTSVLRQLEEPSEEFALALIPEAVLCRGGTQARTRMKLSLGTWPPCWLAWRATLV